MEITPAPAPPRRDLTVLDRALAVKVEVHPRFQVRTGTPLCIQDNRWRPCRGSEVPLLFALEPVSNEENRIFATRALVVETHYRTLTLGACRLSNPESHEALQFVNDPEGRYLAVSPSQVLMG